MFGWLKNMFRKRGSGLDYYHPEERLIYTYFDGEVDRSVDPAPLHEAILAKKELIYADFKTMDFGDEKFGPIAEARLTKTIREVFGLKPLGENFSAKGTLTNGECLVLIDHFLLYVDEKIKKKLIANQQRSSNPSTDGCPATTNSLPSVLSEASPSGGQLVPSGMASAGH